MAEQRYSNLLHSPHNKRKSYNSPTVPSQKKGKSKSKKSTSPTKTPSYLLSRKFESSPRIAPDLKCPGIPEKLDLKSPRYFTSPENDEHDFKSIVSINPRICPVIKEAEYPILRKAAVDQMIRDRKSEDRLKGDKWEERKTRALLDASEIERGLLKDILFNKSVDNHTYVTSKVPTISLIREGPIYKEVLASPRSPKSTRLYSPNPRSPISNTLSPNRRSPTSPRISPEDLIKINNLTISDNSEIENDPVVISNKKHVKVRAKDVTMSPSPRCISPIKRDMSSSYKEEDFTRNSCSKSRKGRSEDKSINTSPVRSLTETSSPTKRGTTSPTRRSTSPTKSPTRSAMRGRTKSPTHSESNAHDTLDTVSELVVDQTIPVSGRSSPKKVSFVEDSTDKSLKIHRLEHDLQAKDMEMMEMRHNSLNLQKKLGELETMRIALESEKLHLSLQNITHSAAQPPAPGIQQSCYLTPAGGGSQTTPKQNINTAFNDINEVNNMIQQLRAENQSLQTSLQQATIQTQLQTQLLEERLQCLVKERDNFASENKRYQRIIAQDDKGSRIALLQRDLQNQMSENEKLKSHLQILRESYTKFFGATI